MVLATENRAASKWHYGDQVVTLPAGKSIKIETSPQGEELLNAEVPAGKTWTVRVTVHIEET